jgi:hypothetical protein
VNIQKGIFRIGEKKKNRKCRIENWASDDNGVFGALREREHDGQNVLEKVKKLIPTISKHLHGLGLRLPLLPCPPMVKQLHGGTPCERSWEISHRYKLSYNYPVFCRYPGMTFCTRVRLLLFL